MKINTNGITTEYELEGPAVEALLAFLGKAA